MSKRGQDTTSSDSFLVAQARPTNLVLQSQRKEGASLQGPESPVNPEKEYNRTMVGLATGHWGSFKRGSYLLQGNLSRKANPERKVKRTPLAQRNLTHHHHKWRKWGSRTISIWPRIFQCSQKKLGQSSIGATFSIEPYKTNVMICGLFMTSSMKAAIHLGPDFQQNSEIYKTQDSRTLRMCSTSLKN